jgi:phosphoribosyl 1,2-cyclic phosphate phosphodiesterase
MSFVFTILGSGSSAGVPRVAQGWGACDPSNPKNRRRRCSLLAQRTRGNGTTTVLIDTSPDLRVQLLDAEVTRLDGVLYTHEHADHTHGIDDLRPLVIHHRRRIDAFLDQRTSTKLHERFGYCFETPPGGSYPPILTEHRMEADKPLIVEGEGGAIAALPFEQLHGDSRSLGFRIGKLAYSCDVSDIPPQSFSALQDLDVWILDALRYTPHPSHFSLEQSLAWIERIRPRRAILTNLHTDLDYDTLRKEIPANVEPAFDGMRVELAE